MEEEEEENDDARGGKTLERFKNRGRRDAGHLFSGAGIEVVL